MTAKFTHVHCGLCNAPIGLVFDFKKPAEKIYCNICAEAVMTFTNEFSPDYYNFDSFWDRGSEFKERFKYRLVAATYYMDFVQTQAEKDKLYDALIKANKLK